MENRRGFLGKVASLVGIAVIPKVVDLKPRNGISLETTADVLKYRGFVIYWTGWKGSPYWDLFTGQWCAYQEKNYDPKAVRFYASYPGGQGEYFPGMYFDVHVEDWQKVPRHGTPDSEMMKFRTDALARVMVLIDSFVG